MQTPKKLAILAIALLLFATGFAAAKEGGRDAEREKDDHEKAEKLGKLDDRRDHGPAAYGRHGDRWILHNDQIAVWFAMGHNKAKPDMRIAFNGSDDEKSGFRVQILRLYEARADDPTSKGGLPSINLAKADDWNVDIEEGNGTMTLTMVRAEMQGIVTLVWHIDTVSAAVKYDVKVDNWRWANTSNVLVLDMRLVGRNLHNATGDSVSVEDAGYVSWEPTAEAKFRDGSTRTINVTAMQKGSREHSDENDDIKGSHLLLVFEGAGGAKSIDYDPTFGIASSDAQMRATPGFTVAIVALASVAAILLVRRRL